MRDAKVGPLIPSEYLDANAYLRDYFQFRKNSEAKFSFDSWSKELGLKSRSHLRMILMGKKKITQGFIDSFCRTSSLSESEKEYFYLMVQYTQAKNQTDRRIYSSKMIQTLRVRTGVVEIENHFRFLSNPLLPRIMTLLTFEDFKATSTDIAFSLGLGEKEAVGLLEELEAIALATRERDSNGLPFWKSTIKIFDVPDRFADLALMRFHESTLHDAIQALRAPSPETRFRSLIFPLNASEMDELYKALNEFLANMLAKFASDHYQGRRLFQLNSSLFPVAAEVSADAVDTWKKEMAT